MYLSVCFVTVCQSVAGLKLSRDGLECLILLSLPPNTGMTGIHHHTQARYHLCMTKRASLSVQYCMHVADTCTGGLHRWPAQMATQARGAGTHV